MNPGVRYIGTGRFFTLVGPPTTNLYAWSIGLPDQPPFCFRLTVDAPGMIPIRSVLAEAMQP